MPARDGGQSSDVGHVDVAGVRYELPDGRVLLDDVSFRVGEGAKVALVGANGAGKTTLLRIITGELTPHAGAVTRSGGLGVMRQMRRRRRSATTPRSADLLLQRLAAADPRGGRGGRPLRAGADGDRRREVPDGLRPRALGVRRRRRLRHRGHLGRLHDGRRSALPYDRAKYRELRTLSGGEQKRLVLEFLLRGPDEVLLLDEPDNYLDVPGKIWLEGRIRESDKTILMISHDRELLDNTATRVVTVELGHAGNLVWTHPGGFASYHEARRDRFLRFEELRKRWDEEHAKLKQLVLQLQDQVRVQRRHGVAVPRRPDPAAQVRGGRPADRAAARAAGHDAPPGRPHRQARGGLRGPRADRADEALRPRGLVRRARGGARAPTAPASRTSCACWRPAAATPTSSTARSATSTIKPVPHVGKAKLGARVRPGWFVQTHEHPELIGRTLLEILHRGDGSPNGRAGMGREQAARVLDRYELAHAGEQKFESLCGGQQARFQILLLELSGATLLLLDEPTDNLDVQSAEALEEGLEAFDGTVLAVTHDRWFARGFDRFLVYGADGEVYESDGPVWDEGRVQRSR